MQICVNGQTRDVPAEYTAADLVNLLGLQPRRIAVECNKRIVRRTRYADTRLQEGDVLEIVTLVSGG